MDSSSLAEVYSYSKTDNHWKNRLESDGDQRRETLRSWLFGTEDLPRHGRCLVPWDQGAVVSLEALRRFPEGGVWVLPSSPDQERQLKDFLVTLPKIHHPLFLPGPFSQCFDQEWDQNPEKKVEYIFSLGLPLDLDLPAVPWENILTSHGELRFLVHDPLESTRISTILPASIIEEIPFLKEKEEQFLQEKRPLALKSDLPQPWSKTLYSWETEIQLTQNTWDSWFDPQRQGSLGYFLGSPFLENYGERLKKGMPGKKLLWKRSYQLIHFSPKNS